ncbi:hypothetical protein [uncultured Polaribacter sp.]|uniref:hypothetical protein n=1 Tax=uncultured Polaribacter sp. TaxID=174711 RepID=UPI002608BE7D|nr:hypothetical protein [uncultured Polaribacter sp.]
MKNLLTFLIAIAITITGNAQDLGDVKITSKKYGLSKMKKASKKIYINSFHIDFEVYKEAVDFKAGGDGGRISGNKSSATARAAVGLGGVDANKIQEKTNLLFNNYVSRLKKEGYEIISGEEAGKTKTLSGWEKASGPYLKESRTGIITCAPENYTFYYKKAGILGLGGLGVQAKLSKELGDVIIADVNMHVMFSENGSDFFSAGGAKVKILTNLRLIDQYTVTIPKKLKKKNSTMGKLFGSVQLKGAVENYPINSMVSFAYGKTGLGSTAQFTGTLKDNIEIEGVMKKEKIVAYQKQGSFVPTSLTTFSDYSNALADRFSKTAKWIEVDADKYAQGFYNACNTFLNKQLDEFFSKL